MLAAAQAALLAAPAGLLGIAQPAGAAALALGAILLAYGLLNMYYGLVYSALQDIVAPHLRGTAMSLYFMAMYLCGASFGPILTGRLSDLLARRAAAGSPVISEAARAAGLHQAMYVLPVLALALALVLYAGSRTIQRDMARRA
jgi:MFS family permease